MRSHNKTDRSISLLTSSLPEFFLVTGVENWCSSEMVCFEYEGQKYVILIKHIFLSGWWYSLYYSPPFIFRNWITCWVCDTWDVFVLSLNFFFLTTCCSAFLKHFYLCWILHCVVGALIISKEIVKWPPPWPLVDVFLLCTMSKVIVVSVVQAAEVWN